MKTRLYGVTIYIASYRPDKKLIHKPLRKPIPSKNEDYIFPFPFSFSTKTMHGSNASTARVSKAQAAEPLAFACSGAFYEGDEWMKINA